MCVFIFSKIFVWNISHSWKNLARYDQKCVSVFIWSTRYSCLILMKWNFLDRFSKNIQISNLFKIHLMGAELFHEDRWTDTRTNSHDEASSRFPQLCERAYRPWMYSIKSSKSKIIAPTISKYVLYINQP
jgi:hypothetical protein